MNQSKASIVNTVEQLVVSEGDILHVKLGGPMGDGQPPWIPSDDDCEVHRQDWQDALEYLGIKARVVVTHQFVELKVIKPMTFLDSLTAKRLIEEGNDD